MFAKSILITGCNRGLGLQLVKQLANQTEYLFAGCRHPSEAKELNETAEQHKNITVLELDVTNQTSIDSARLKVSEKLATQGLNCLINNAGCTTKGDYKIEKLTSEQMRGIYEVNSIAPAMMVKAFLPLLRKASLCDHDDMSISRASILNMSSVLASIEVNETGTVYSYRMSKASLNMLTKNLSIELKNDNILVVSIHPGWVQTDMGGPRAPVTIQDSIDGILKVVSTLNKESSGLFYSWDGSNIPW